MKLLADSDATGYDPVTHYLYIADGGLDAKLNYTFLEIVNTDTGEKVGQIKIDSNRLEAMVVEKSGSRLFLNMTEKNSIGVIDRKKQAVAAVWPLTCKVNASVAIDEKNHRLFAACRDGNMNVLDSDTGKVLQNLPISTGVDDMVFDPASQRVYVATGEGFVNVYQGKRPGPLSGHRENSHWSAGQDRAIGSGIERVFCGCAAARSHVRGGSGLRRAVSSTATLGCVNFAIVDSVRMRGLGENHTAKSGCATRTHSMVVMAAATARHFPSCFTNTRVTRHWPLMSLPSAAVPFLTRRSVRIAVSP